MSPNRPTLIDRILAGLDAKIAELQRARQNLIDMRAELDSTRGKAPTGKPSTRRKPTPSPPVQS